MEERKTALSEKEERQSIWIEIEMKTIKIRNLEIGSGIPKICVPIVGKTRKEITSLAKVVKNSAADFAEWRVDWYEEGYQWTAVKETAQLLREILGEMPLLFTFRTAQEGGEKEISKERYEELNCQMAESKLADMIDVEVCMGKAIVQRIISVSHVCKTAVILSNHDFEKTPEKEEIIARLCRMQELDADIAKIAVMPQNAKDVLVLLSATQEMASCYAKCPIITMSMAQKGMISRVSGEIFGSAVTFGTVGRASAPGQIEAGKLKEALHVLHEEKPE